MYNRILKQFAPTNCPTAWLAQVGLDSLAMVALECHGPAFFSSSLVRFLVRRLHVFLALKRTGRRPNQDVEGTPTRGCIRLQTPPLFISLNSLAEQLAPKNVRSILDKFSPRLQM